MNGLPFEDPAKTALVARCRTAVEAAAYTLSPNLEKLEIPAELGLQGAVQGDLQSIDGSGVRYVYVIRPGTPKTLPIWAGRWAAACHRMKDVRLYVVVEDYEAGFDAECKKAGAGLLIISAADQFELIHTFEDNLPEDLDQALEARVKELRRQALTKLDLNLNLVKEKYTKVGTITASFSAQLAESYTRDVELEHDAWTAWSEALNEDLDAALRNRDSSQLNDIEQRIAEGPLIERDDEDVA